MESIPREITQIIFSFLPITSKRQFIRTCRTYSYDMTLSELEFQKMINSTKFFYAGNYTGFYNPLYKFTIELFYDGASIPDHYVTPENRVLHQYKNIYYEAAQRGDLNLIKRLLALNRDNFLESNADWVCRGAAKVGNHSILEWMEKNYQLDSFTTAYAAKGNQFHTLKWLRDRGCPCPWDHRTSSNAARSGNMKMLRWVIKSKCKIDDAAICLAAEKNHFKIVKWLFGKYPKKVFQLDNSVGISGNLEMVKWAIENIDPEDFSGAGVCEGAASKGHLHILEWMGHNREIIEDDEDVGSICRTAATENHLDCLKWCIKNGHLRDKSGICVWAARNGNLKMIKLLMKNGCTYTPKICEEAGMHGHLHILEWAKANSYKLAHVCNSAAWGGRLEIIQWGRRNGCEWDLEVCSYAATNGHLDVIKYAIANGCELDVDVCESAVMHNHLDVLKWLGATKGSSLGANLFATTGSDKCNQTDGVCESAIKYGNLDVLVWAIENGCPCDARTLKKALDFWNMFTKSGKSGSGTYKKCLKKKHSDIMAYWHEKVAVRPNV